MAYSFYLDGTELPVAPGSLKLKIQNTNKTLTLISGGEVNLLKTPGLTDIEFTVLLPAVQHGSSSRGRFRAGKRFLTPT